MNASLTDKLDKPYTLTAEQIDFYQKNRFIKLKNVFDTETIAHFNRVITDKVTELSKTAAPLEKRFYNCSTCGVKMKQSNPLCSVNVWQRLQPT